MRLDRDGGVVRGDRTATGIATASSCRRSSPSSRCGPATASSRTSRRRRLSTEILQDAGLPASGITWRLAGSYQQRTYTVQYRESEWEFVERLLAEEGINVWFEQTEDGRAARGLRRRGRARTTRSRAPSPCRTRIASGMAQSAASFFFLERRRELVHDRVALRDYDVRHPDVPIEGAAGDGALEWYEYPGLRDARRGRRGPGADPARAAPAAPRPDRGPERLRPAPARPHRAHRGRRRRRVLGRACSSWRSSTRSSRRAGATARVGAAVREPGAPGARRQAPRLPPGATSIRSPRVDTLETARRDRPCRRGDPRQRPRRRQGALPLGSLRHRATTRRRAGCARSR